MENFQMLRIFNKLKSVYRFASVENRKESTAEHTWAALMLADYFLSSAKYKLDRLKVYELLMYHDLVEIESGDFPLHLTTTVDRKEAERLAVESLQEKIPLPLNQKFVDLYNEFEKRESLEAQFARAIDSLEAEIHELDYIEDWKGYTKDYIVAKKMHLFDKFPEMHQMYEKIVEYLDVNGYFDN